jgi:vacuolar-type H+-ATPase subunit I/STV1
VAELDTKKASLKQEQDLVDKMASWCSGLEVYSKALRKLKPVKDVLVPSCDAIESKISEQQELNEYLNKVNGAKSVILRLREVKKVSIPEELEKELDVKLKEIVTFKNLQKKHEALVSQISTIKKVKDITIPKVPDNDLSGLELLKSKYSKMSSLVIDVKTLRGSVEEIKKNLENTDTELSKYSNCPACGAEKKSWLL